MAASDDTKVIQPSWLKTEWEQFIGSKTVKAVIASESIAIGIFINGVMDGTQKLTIDALKPWLCGQAVAIFVLTLRHCFAGIQAIAEANGVPHLVIAQAEEKGKALVIAAIAETHPEVAKMAAEATKGTPPK